MSKKLYDAQLIIPLSKAQKVRLQQVATHKTMSASALARMLLTDGLARYDKDCPMPEAVEYRDYKFNGRHIREMNTKDHEGRYDTELASEYLSYLYDAGVLVIDEFGYMAQTEQIGASDAHPKASRMATNRYWQTHYPQQSMAEVKERFE